MSGAARVAWFIKARREELYPTKAEFLRASKELDPQGVGISAKTVTDWESGRPIVRGDKRALLLRALKWERTSIDTTLAGGTPVESGGTDADTGSVGSALTAMGEDLAALRATVDDLERRFRAINQRRGAGLPGPPPRR